MLFGVVLNVFEFIILCFLFVGSDGMKIEEEYEVRVIGGELWGKWCWWKDKNFLFMSFGFIESKMKKSDGEERGEFFEKWDVRDKWLYNK